MTHIYYLTFSVGQGFQKGFVVLFWLEIPQVVAFKWHLKLKEQEAGAAGSWLGALSPYSLRILHNVSLHGKLWASSQHGRITGVGLPTWLLRLLPAQEFQETGKSFQASHDQGSEVTQCHFSHVLYIKISYRDQNGEDYTKV